MTKISLNGNWNYIKDPENKFQINSIKNFIKSKELPSIKVPSNWELEGFHNYSGVIWYIKHFKIPDKQKLETCNFLEFNGVDYFADIWLNGNYLGNHEGYFQKFYINVSDKLLFESNNIIIIKVNSPREEPEEVWPLKKQLIKGIFNHHDCRPGSWSLEHGQDMNTGGIWNDVNLFYNTKLIINNTKITSILDNDYKSATINVSIDYRSNFSEPKNVRLKIDILDSNSNKTELLKNIELSSGNSQLDISFKLANPLLWWSWDLGTQNQYKIKFNIKNVITFTEKFAIRKVEINENDQFLLNGKNLFLRGTNIIPAQFLSELKKKRIKKIVGLIKEANINAVRVHAHVNRKELYEEFDKAGIIVWQDFSLQWTYEESDKFRSNAVKQIKDMVNLLYNNPSICFWCCHNEPGEQIHTLDHLLKDGILSQDQTRIIRNASNYEEHPYDGWYWGNMEHFAAAPMGPLVTEFGAQALPVKKSLQKFIPEEKLYPPNIDYWKYHNFQPDTTFNIAKIDTGNNIDDFIENSQKYQSDLIKTAVHFYRRKKKSNISGLFQFMFIDCWPSITWSIVDYYLQKKQAFETLKECYSPLFLSVNFRQDQYFPNSKLNFDFHIINDLHEKFENLEIYIYISGKKISQIKKLEVNENDIYFQHFESHNINIPKHFGKGTYIIEYKLVQNKIILTTTKFNLKIVNNPV